MLFYNRRATVVLKSLGNLLNFLYNYDLEHDLFHTRPKPTWKEPS